MERAPQGDDEQNAPDELRSAQRADSTLDLLTCLREKAAALHVAAHETRTETDALPRNLLAAFIRIERHVEMFLKVTNEARAQMRGSSEMLAAIRLLRTECAQRMLEIGNILDCGEGFLRPHAFGYDEPECRRRLDSAAGQVGQLVDGFMRLLRDFAPATESPS